MSTIAEAIKKYRNTGGSDDLRIIVSSLVEEAVAKEIAKHEEIMQREMDRMKEDMSKVDLSIKKEIANAMKDEKIQAIIKDVVSYLVNRGISLAKGDKGEKGDRGERGLMGERGVPGEMGAKGLQGDKGKDGSPDTPEEVATKLNTLNEAINQSAIKGLIPTLRNLRESIRVKNIGGGGGAGGGNVVKAYDISSLLDGVTKTFTIPTNRRVLGVRASSAPFTFRPTTDFTSTRTSITFTSEISAAGTLAAGQTVLVEYIN